MGVKNLAVLCLQRYLSYSPPENRRPLWLQKCSIRRVRREKKVWWAGYWRVTDLTSTDSRKSLSLNWLSYRLLQPYSIKATVGMTEQWWEKSTPGSPRLPGSLLSVRTPAQLYFLKSERSSILWRRIRRISPQGQARSTFFPPLFRHSYCNS